MFVLRIFLGLALILGLAACDNSIASTPPIGEAYVAPPSLNIRQEISLRSATVATVHHGDELDVVEVKRRWVKVRTDRGVEGWTEARNLMSVQQMKDLRRLAADAAKMPSQGEAVALEAMNMHTLPNRLAPAFYQIPEKAKMDVLGRQVTPRNQPAPETVSFPRPVRPRKPKPKEKNEIAIPPPAPPPPPPNWIELSRTVQPESADTGPTEARPGEIVAKEPPKVDDWSLVRTPDGHAGWVLSRMYNMAIPDEVAQYAEGHRITSYFPLGSITDDEQGVKNHWLWTTMAGVNPDYDFDSFRVFIWNRRRHRYETAYIEKRIEGHYPVQAGLDGKQGAFSIITSDDSGQWIKRTFLLEGYLVRKLSAEPYQRPAAGQPVTTPSSNPSAPQVQSSFARLKQTLSKWFAR
jgi:SH3-like domain-containing protein